MTQPITPQEVGARQAALIPPEVLEVFNDLIAKYWNGRNATFTLNSVAEGLEAIFMVKRQVMFERGWFDVEEAYRMAGWKVEYEQPGYCERGDATYTFTLK
jgi:hypothetical protein